MKSPRGFAAAVAFLLTLPIAALFQAMTGGGVEVIIHLVLALGAALMAVAVFDFRTPRWIAWTGAISLGVLAVTFLLQGVSELTHNESLTHFVYQVLGQRLEGAAGDLFLLWCVAVLLLDSRGWTKVVGVGAVTLAVGMRVYAYYLSYRGTSLDAAAPGLKVLALLPLGWLLLESRKPRAEVRGTRGIT